MSQGIISAQTLYLRYFLRFLSGALSRIVTRAGNSGKDLGKKWFAFSKMEKVSVVSIINAISGLI